MVFIVKHKILATISTSHFKLGLFRATNQGIMSFFFFLFATQLILSDKSTPACTQKKHHLIYPSTVKE